MPNTTTRPAPGPHPAPWRSVLLALRQAGARAGIRAADWWAQDTVGGRASGDTTTTARAVLAGIADGDPAVLDALPTCDLSSQGADTPTEAEVYADAAPPAAPPDAPPWTTLGPAQREEAIGAYRDAFDTAVADRVGQHCRTALPEPGEPASDQPGRAGG